MMQQDNHLSLVEEIMSQFAEETGLQGSGEPQRYLWTDAFAVCNFLELYRRTSSESYRSLALRLVEQVHQVLGRHRNDDDRSGWISGLPEAEGAVHPTSGGLRIGKRLQERQPEERQDNLLEWDRDGQYYHYLTKWMHALQQVSRQLQEPIFAVWARELATAAHQAFVYESSPGGPKRMYWKMSIDLSRPLVTTMGQHDPLDGYLSCLALQAEASVPALAPEVGELESICRKWDWTTDDPLGLGAILHDSLRLVRLISAGVPVIDNLLEDILQAAATGLARFCAQDPMQHPIEYRLAFRELGLSIGLRALDRIDTYTSKLAEKHNKKALAPLLQSLSTYRPLCQEIEQCWLTVENRRSAAWNSHKFINSVMLATSLAPLSFLGDELQA